MNPLQDALSRFLRGAATLARTELDADQLLMRSMAATIELAASRYALDQGARWRPGEPLRLLLAGYNGSRNTGADVRVEEMVRQFRHLLGDEHVALSVYTLDPAKTRGYFRTARQVLLPKIFPRTLFDTVHDQHGVVACEGSMFKSKFANALSTMMVGALALAEVEAKLAIGYGGEAGKMDPALEALVRRYCRDALVLCRNGESQDVLARLGVPSQPGTDTAWTFEAGPGERARRLLVEAGWDGRTPILALCPINPFWWPVRPDPVKGVVHALTGQHASSHYASIYFHHDGPEVAERQRAYLEAWASGVARFRRTTTCFPVLIGMEQLDRRACEALDGALGGGHPVLVSDRHDMRELVGVLREARWLLSSRYHAIVTAMPAGVVSAGVTMDERIRNLMADRGQPELALEVDGPGLSEAIHGVLVRLRDDEEAVREGIERAAVSNLERMGRMGMALCDHLRGFHPTFPLSDALGGHGDPWAHLPPLGPTVAALTSRHREAA
jgi:polysaccharide pyruvyl transferase WcaK-like protein